MGYIITSISSMILKRSGTFCPNICPRIQSTGYVNRELVGIKAKAMIKPPILNSYTPTTAECGTNCCARHMVLRANLEPMVRLQASLALPGPGEEGKIEDHGTMESQATRGRNWRASHRIQTSRRTWRTHHRPHTARERISGPGHRTQATRLSTCRAITGFWTQTDHLGASARVSALQPRLARGSSEH